MSIADNWQPGITLEVAERQLIMRALEYTRGNKTMAAQMLGIAIRTLDNKLKAYSEKGNDGRLQIGAIPLQETLSSVPKAERGDDLQPDAEAAKERPVRLRKRQEIQKLPS